MKVTAYTKQTEIGIFPKDWLILSINELSTKVGSGITPTGGSRIYKDYGRTFIRSQNVGWGKLLLEDVVYIDDATHSTFVNTEICIKDVLLNITGASIGRSAVSDSRIVGGNVNQHVCVIRADKDKIDPEFLNIFLLSYIGQGQIKSFQAGGNRQGLNYKQIRSILVSIPSKKLEQNAIIKVISDVDSLLEKLDQLIIKKQNLKQAIMYQLLKGKTRLDGFNKPWEFKSLDELIIKFRKTNRQSSSGKPEGRYPFFTNSTKHYDKYLDEYDFNLEAIIANTGGEAHFNYFKGFFAVMSDCFVFKSKMETQFLYYLLKLMEQEINEKGFSGSGIKHLDKKYFFDIKLYLPTALAEQKAIANILSNIDDEMNALEARRRKTYDIKLAIIQELLTGKTRLLKPKVVNA